MGFVGVNEGGKGGWEGVVLEMFKMGLERVCERKGEEVGVYDGFDMFKVFL